MKVKKFAKWIDTIGVDKLGEILKANRMTVYYWKTGHSYPRVPQMRKIKKLSQGQIDYSDIIERR